MPDIRIPNSNINPDKLNEELRAVIDAAAVPGLSWDDNDIRVHVNGEVTQTMQDTIDAVIAAHNPAALTTEQQRRADMIAERRTNRTPIDPDNVTLRELARRLRWMEKELRTRIGDE